MIVTVKRTELPDRTLGELFIDSNYQCRSLEDKCRADNEEKIYGETAIPYGTYEITLRKEGSIYADYCKRFKSVDIRQERGTLWIRNIPGFEYVLIHIGNYIRDTLGCLLVGLNVSTKYDLIDSTVAYCKIYPIIADAIEKGEQVFIEYIKA